MWDGVIYFSKTICDVIYVLLNTTMHNDIEFLTFTYDPEKSIDEQCVSNLFAQKQNIFTK